MAVSDSFSAVETSRRVDSAPAMSFSSACIRSRSASLSRWAAACWRCKSDSAACAMPAPQHNAKTRTAACRIALALLSLALSSHSRHRRLDLGRVAQVVVAYRPKLLVEFVDQGLTGRDIQVDNLIIRDFVEVFNQCPQAI